jgi:hypothetical protein
MHDTSAQLVERVLPAAWEQVKVFVRDRTAAEFTHGICPQCAEHALKDTPERDEAA